MRMSVNLLNLFLLLPPAERCLPKDGVRNKLFCESEPSTITRVLPSEVHVIHIQSNSKHQSAVLNNYLCVCFTVRRQRSPPSLQVSCLSTAETTRCYTVGTSVTWPEWGCRRTQTASHKSESAHGRLRLCIMQREQAWKGNATCCMTWHILQGDSVDRWLDTGQCPVNTYECASLS